MFIGPPGSLGLSLLSDVMEVPFPFAGQNINIKKGETLKRFAVLPGPQEIDLIELGEKMEAIFFWTIATRTFDKTNGNLFLWNFGNNRHFLNRRDEIGLIH